MREPLARVFWLSQAKLNHRKEIKDSTLSYTLQFSSFLPINVLRGLRPGELLMVPSFELIKAVTHTLQESVERAHIVADCTPALLWTTGRDRLCDFVNQGWLAFRGRSLEQEIGNGWAEGVHPDDVGRCLETYYSAFDAHRSFAMACRFQRHDGEYRWVSDKGSPRFDPNGKFMGYVGSVVDISDQKLAEESIRNLEHLHRLVSLEGLSAAIAHELRQPLTAIRNNMDAAALLLDCANPPLDVLREIISDVLADDDRANEVISRIREFSLKRELRMSPLSLNSIVSDTLLLLDGDALSRRVELSVELAGDLPFVLGDRTQLQQVLMNLAINAIDAMVNTPEALRYLTLQTKLNGEDQVEVAVTDCGGGIGPDVLPHLFEPFFTTKVEGMGLGLSLVKSIIGSHRGHIWVENNSCGGATFRFTVPVAAERANERAMGCVLAVQATRKGPLVKLSRSDPAK